MGDWIRDLIAHGGYLAVAGLMLLETVFPPIPSELIMSLAGIEAAAGRLSLPLAIVAGTVGAMLGNLFWYALARRLGTDRFRRFVAHHGRWLTLTLSDVDRADRFFARLDRWFVCLGRMVPTIRSLVSIPAGLFGMRLGAFLLWSTLGSAGWTAALALAGRALGVTAGIDGWLGPVSNGVIALLAVAYLWRVVQWRRG